MASVPEEVLSSIGGETLEKARRELGEDPETRAHLIDQLRTKIEEAQGNPEHEDVKFVRRDGKFLLRFLRARKFNVDRAAQLYCNYCKFRHKYEHIVGDMHPRAVEHVLCSGVMGMTDLRGKDGSTVVHIHPARWDPDSIQFEDNFRAMILILDKVIEDEENQVHGISILNNLHDVTFSTVFKLSQTEPQRKGMFIEMVQDCFPCRFKGLHLVNQPWYISLVVMLVKPFMKQKLRDRFFMHGTDYTTLYEHFDVEKLPPSLGGLGGEFDPLYLLEFFEKELAERPTSDPHPQLS